MISQTYKTYQYDTIKYETHMGINLIIIITVIIMMIIIMMMSDE